MENALRVALAETFAFYLLAHMHHWNVRGPLLKQFHDLFGQIYEDANDGTDKIAERIRVIGGFAPSTPPALLSLSSISFPDVPPPAAEMVAQLFAANEIVIRALNAANDAVEAGGEYGIANTIQERLDIHGKNRWMLRDTLSE